MPHSAVRGRSNRKSFLNNSAFAAGGSSIYQPRQAKGLCCAVSVSMNVKWSIDTIHVAATIPAPLPKDSSGKLNNQTTNRRRLTHHSPRRLPARLNDTGAHSLRRSTDARTLRPFGYHPSLASCLLFPAFRSALRITDHHTATPQPNHVYELSAYLARPPSRQQHATRNTQHTGQRARHARTRRPSIHPSMDDGKM